MTFDGVKTAMDQLTLCLMASKSLISVATAVMLMCIGGLKKAAAALEKNVVDAISYQWDNIHL
jgi:hypothetical protein